MENNNHLHTYEHGECSSSTQKPNHDSAQLSSPYPPGYRFMPTDLELITYYLLKKVNNEPIPISGMCEVNLYEHTPFHLAENYHRLGDNEMYFFTPRNRKYPNGIRPNRAVGGVGYWKATGADKKIRKDDGKVIGKKTVLVFYMGKPKPRIGMKTNWIMHEYKLKNSSKSPNGDKNMRLDDWVLCRMYLKPERLNKNQKNDDDANDAGALDIQNNDVMDDQNQDDYGLDEYQHVRPDLAIETSLTDISQDVFLDDQNIYYNDPLLWGSFGPGEEYAFDISDDIKNIFDGFLNPDDYGAMVLSNGGMILPNDVALRIVDHGQQVDDYAATINVDGQQAVGGVEGRQVFDVITTEVDDQHVGGVNGGRVGDAATRRGKEKVDDQRVRGKKKKN